MKRGKKKFRKTQPQTNPVSTVMREAMPDVYFREKVAVMDALQQNGITLKELEEN